MFVQLACVIELKTHFSAGFVEKKLLRNQMRFCLLAFKIHLQGSAFRQQAQVYRQNKTKNNTKETNQNDQKQNKDFYGTFESRSAYLKMSPYIIHSYKSHTPACIIHNTSSMPCFSYIVLLGSHTQTSSGIILTLSFSRFV